MATYATTYTWAGSLQPEDYTREAEVVADEAPPIPVSATVANGGRADRFNPETLLGAALTDCYALTFLAIARKARLDVRRLVLVATLTVSELEGKRRHVSHVELVGTAHVAPGTSADKVRTVFDKAHKYCVVSNSLASPMDTRVEVVEVAG